MKIFSNKEIDLNSLKKSDILDMIDKRKVTSSTSWLGSRRVQIAGKEGSASYRVFAAKLHETLNVDIDTLTLKDKLYNGDRIKLVQSLHSSIIRKVINLVAQLLFITRVFGYNQSLRDLQNDKNSFSRVTKDIWDTYFSGCVESKVTVDGTEYYRVSDRDLARAAIQEQEELDQDLQRDLESKDTTIQGLQRDLGSKNTTIQGLQESLRKKVNLKNTGSKTLITSLEEKIAAKTDEINQLKATNQKLEESEQTAQGNKRAAESALASLGKKQLTQRETIKTQSKSLTELQANCTKLQEQLEETRAQFESDRDLWHATRQTLYNEKAELSDQVKGLRLKVQTTERL